MKNNTLKHISFILDGNKRWAEKNKLNETEGYKKGIDKIYEIINYCYNNKIKHVTLYLLSTENINRKNNKFFFRLAKEYFQSNNKIYVEEFLRNEEINKSDLIEIHPEEALFFAKINAKTDVFSITRDVEGSV